VNAAHHCVTVVTAFQIHTDMIGVYCSVNRQVMKLDRGSVIC
jgi:hypothetical protein